MPSSFLSKKYALAVSRETLFKRKDLNAGLQQNGLVIDSLAKSSDVCYRKRLTNRTEAIWIPCNLMVCRAVQNKIRNVQTKAKMLSFPNEVLCIAFFLLPSETV